MGRGIKNKGSLELPGGLWERNELTLNFFLTIYFLAKITQKVHPKISSLNVCVKKRGVIFFLMNNYIPNYMHFSAVTFKWKNYEIR